MTLGEDITTLGELAESLVTMRQDYADLDAANVKLGTDLISAWAEADKLKESNEKLMLHLVDVVWGDVHEDESVPCTQHALWLIQKAKDSFGEFEEWRAKKDDILRGHQGPSSLDSGPLEPLFPTVPEDIEKAGPTVMP